MEELIAALRKALSDSFVLYFKAHSYHWNVEGMNFPQYHRFFGKMYEEIHAAIDPMAEQIRTLDSYAPRSLKEILNESMVDEEMLQEDLSMMISSLKTENDKVLASLLYAYKIAEEQTELGVSNFLQDRIQAHQKHAWMLRAASK
jgi:starvation-inducible DNA-binding protein